MSELQNLIEQAYEMAKSGHWERLVKEWESSPVLANRCSRFRKNGSSWTFLHQAAYFGNESVCRELIRRGAAIGALTHDSHSPADVAAQKGHSKLAELLRSACISDDLLWSPPSDPDVLPSSNRWGEAKEAFASSEMLVAYAGGLVKIPKGSRYFVDALNRVLVGWHGTYSPPCDMGGESMLETGCDNQD